MEIIIVCNGCTDETELIAGELARQCERVRVLVSPAEQGKAGALNRGVAAAEGEFIIFADVRQTFRDDAIARLLEPFADPAVGAVSGRLVVSRSDQAAINGLRWYWGMETLLRLAESRTGSVIGVTGAIYAIRRERFVPFSPNLILDDVWLPLQIVQQGYRVLLAPDAVAYDLPVANQRLEYERKRRTMVGNLQLIRAMPSLLSPRLNPVFVRFISHKLLRLTTPFCFLGLVIATAFIPGPFFQTFFLLGAAAYLFGLVGLAVRLPGLSLAAAFVMMHAAVFAALRRMRQDATLVWATPTPSGERQYLGSQQLPISEPVGARVDLSPSKSARG